MRIKSSFLIISLMTIISFTNCQKKSELVLQGTTQGTFYTIKYISKNNYNYQKEIDSILIKIDNSLSLYNDNSVLSKLNRREPGVKPDSLIIDNLRAAIDMYTMSDGAFDVTCKPLFDAWGFGKHRTKKPLSADSIQKILKVVGMDCIELNADSTDIIFLNDQVQLGFNAIAQGYSVSLVADYLDTQGINNYIIEIGGEVFARGRRSNGTKWRVGIVYPSDTITEIIKELEIENQAVITSGSYLNYYEYEGRKYAHVIDPRTGYPAENGILSATVIHNNPSYADAWATTLMVLGLEETKKLLKQHSEIKAFVVYNDENGEYQQWTNI